MIYANSNVKCAGQSLFPVDLVGHDVVKVITGDETIVIEISLVEHVVPFVLGEILAQFLSNFLEFVNGDLALHHISSTDLLTSNEPQTLSISARLSFSPNLAVASLKNSAKSIPPD